MNDFDIQRESTWGYRPLLIIIAILIVMFFTWAAFSKIEQHVHALGRIIPAAQTKIVQHLEGGIVNEILVSEGEAVEKGQVILKISNQRTSSELQELTISIEALKIKRARLKAEYSNAREFSYEVPSAELVDTLENEKRLFDSRHQVFDQKISGLNEQITQKRLKQNDLSAQLANLASERSVAQNQLDINERLRRSGAVSESRYLDTVSQVKNFDTRIAQVRNSTPIVKAEIQEVRKKITEEQQSRQTLIVDELNKVELDIQQSTERLKTYSDEVKRTDIPSPVKGMVNKLYVNTVGGVVRPGEPLVEIIPMDENLIAEARVATKDRGLIWVGLPAIVKVTAYDYAIYGGIKGKVTEISADSLTDENGARFYRVRLSLSANSLKGQPLYPGMTVEGNIIAGKKSILHSLLKPIWRLQENALREP